MMHVMSSIICYSRSHLSVASWTSFTAPEGSFLSQETVVHDQTHHLLVREFVQMPSEPTTMNLSSAN